MNKRHKSAGIAWAALLAVAAGRLWGQAVSATGNGTLSGQALDEAQRPIHGARVDVSAVPVGKAAFHPYLASARTAATGVFSLSVPAGTYRVCVQMRGSELLNPCEWEKTAPQTVVSGGQAATMHALVMKRGYPVTVQLIDTASALWNETAKHSQSTIVVSVTGADGMAHPIPVRQQNSGMREHVLLAPRDTALTVTVTNRGFNLTDAAGAAVAQPAAGAASAAPGVQSFGVKIAGEKSQRLFQYRVAGVKGN